MIPARAMSSDRSDQVAGVLGRSCPSWCAVDHDVELQPGGRLQHRRVVDLITLEGAGDQLLTVCIVQDLEDGGPARVATSGAGVEVLNVAAARAYARALDRAVDELAAIEVGIGAAAGGSTSCSREPLLEEWAGWMRAAGMSERTIRSRSRLVVQVSRVAGAPAAELGWQQVAAFLARDLKPTTRSTYFADLRAWFDWLRRMGHRVDDPTERLHKPRMPRRRPRPITTPQLETLLRHANRRRTRTMVLLAAYAGLRVHEIAKFRGDDVVRDGMLMTNEHGEMSTCDALRVSGKGGVEELLPLHPVLAAEARSYDPVGWWFPAYGRGDVPITGNSVCAVVSRLADRAGVNATAHQIRHWYGTQVLRAAGGNLRVAQELLRHASPATSAGYTYVDGAERRAAMLALPRLTERR